MFVRLSSVPFWARMAIGVAAGLLLILVFLRVFAMTPIARGMVESRLEAATVRGQSIEIEGLKGDVLGRVLVEQVSVHDEQGVWANASNVEVRWSPLRAFLGHLKIDAVAIADLSVTRRPDVLPALPRSESSSGPFNRYEVRRVEVSALSMAQNIAGPAQLYALDADLNARRRSGDFTLNLVPVGGRGDEIQGEVSWGGSVPLQGDLSVAGAPSGLIATLLQAPEGQGVYANLTASGAVDAWQMSVDGKVGDETVLAFDASMLSGRQKLEGNVSLERVGVLDELKQLFGEQISFNAELDETEQLSAAISADALTLQLSGNFSREGSVTKIDDLRLDVPSLDFARLSDQPDLELSSLFARGALELGPDARVFTGEVSAPRFLWAGYAANAVKSNGRHELRGTVLALENEIVVQSVSGFTGALGGLLKEPLRLTSVATMDLARQSVEFERLNFRNPSVMGEASGSVSLMGPVDVSGVVRLGAVSFVDQFDGTWSYRGSSLDDAKISISGETAFASSLQVLSAEGADNAQIEIVARRVGADLILESGLARSESVLINADGALRQGNLDLKGRVTSPALTFGEASAESLSLSIQVAGRVDAPLVDLNGASDRITLFGQFIESPVIKGRLSFIDQFEFDLDAGAVYLDADLHCSLQGHYQDGIVSLEGLQIDWESLVATGQGKLVLSALHQSTLAFNIGGTAPNVGSMDGLVSYSGETLNTDLIVAELAYGPIVADTARVQASGVWPNFQGVFDYDGDVRILNESTPISGRHGLNIKSDDQVLILDGAAQIGAQNIAIISPLMLELAPPVQFQGELGAFGGSVLIDIHPTGEQPSQLAFNEISMERMGPLISRPSLRGEMSGQAELSLIGNHLTGSFHGAVSGLARGAPGAPQADLAIDAVIEAREMVAHVRARDTDEKLDLVGTLSMPLNYRDSIFSIRPEVGGLVPVSLKGGGPIAPLWALVAPPDLRLEGDLQIDINNGIGAAFQFNGPMRFANGVFEDGVTGFHLDDVYIDATLQASGVSVQQASASGVRGGRIEASGLYDFDGAGTVQMQLHRLNALNRADIDATVSGSANIDRRNRRTHIEGALKLDEARVNLSSMPGTGYTTMDVVFADQLGQDEFEAPVREAISLDVGVSAARRVFVTGPATDSEWNLDARITGSPGQPSIIGRASLVRGEADLLSRRFRLSEGIFRFVGDPSDTEFAISAERADGEISAWIDVTGNVRDPIISLRADPPLPDDEIIARVLFGRSPGELSPLQTAQLAGAAAQLAGGEAFSLMNQLEAAVGLDRLDFGFDDSGAAILSTGKYLADDVYLELQSGGTGAPGVALEWTPLNNVAVDAEVDPELGPKVSIKWKRDFDDRPEKGESE